MTKNNQDSNNNKERDGEGPQLRPHDTQATQHHPPCPQAMLMGQKGELQQGGQQDHHKTTMMTRDKGQAGQRTTPP